MKLQSSLMLALAVAASLATPAAAWGRFGGHWAAAHPRRAEVNARLRNQSMRINQEYREGELTRGQARTLHAEDRSIRAEERSMAALDGGHLTRAETRALNQQENAVSHQIPH